MNRIVCYIVLISILLTSVNTFAQKDKEKKSTYMKMSIDNATQPLFVIDGIIMTKRYNIDLIDPNDIESITVLKGEMAKTLYGEEGKNGVLKITTKKNASKKGVLISDNGTNLISYVYSKKLKENTFIKTYKVEVDNNLSYINLSILGNVYKGMVNIAVTNPAGKQVIPGTELEDEGIVIDKTIRFENEKEAKGTWKISINAINATGDYKIVFKGNLLD